MVADVKKRIYSFLLFLFSVLFILCIAAGAGWWALVRGVELEGLSLHSAYIEKIFLQYDNGFITRIGRININASGTETGNLTRLEKWASATRRILPFIREIDIDQIKYLNHTASFSYNDGKFTVIGDYFSLETQADYAMGAYYFDVEQLDIKPYRISFSGKASYIGREKRFLFDGMFDSSWGTGEIRVTEKNGQVETTIKSEEFSRISPFLRQFPIDREAIEWVSENIDAQSYRIDQLLLHFSLNELEKIGPENISGKATAQSATIQFSPELPPVKCDTINVSFQDDRLTFDLDHPAYEGRSIAGSNVYIDNVIEPDSVLAINIHATDKLDEAVLDILEAFDITLPFRQLSGETRAAISLLYDLPEFELTTKGIFSTRAGDWDWEGIPLQVEEAEVRLTDETITLVNASASYQDILRGSCSGTIDISTGHARLQSMIEDLEFKPKHATLLQGSDINTPVEVDFGGETIKVDLPQLQTGIRVFEEKTEIAIRDLSLAKPYVPLLESLNFSEGAVNISFSDPASIDFNGKFELPDSIFSLDGNPVTMFQFAGTRTPEKTSLSVNDGKILININGKAEISITDYLPTIKADRLKTDKTNSAYPLPIIITGQKILIDIKDFPLQTRKFECRLTDQKIMFTAVLDKGRLIYESAGDRIRLIGNGLDANLAEKFIRFTDLSEGLVNINLEGDADSYIGYLEFSNVVVRKYLLMNNLLAFINSIPALATFSEPGFDYDGYRIKEGIVLFDLQDKLLTIRQLRTDGITVNCEATGWIDLNENTLKLNIELITLKDYSKIIDLLPWAGYAILGEDGSLSTSLKIDGTLDDPNISTSIATDIIMTPVNILWRTIEWPFKLFKSREPEEKKPPEWFLPAPMAPQEKLP